MSIADVLDAVCARRIVPVVVVRELEAALPLAQALAEGGLPVAEVTFRTEAAAGAIRRIAAKTDLLVGAGTIVEPDQVDQAVDAGARFVVTPGFSARVAARCRDLGVALIPGVATATEVITALEHGLTLLKFFPAEPSGGIATLKALHGPFPDVRFVPTGGIAAANAGSYLALPYVAAVGGSWLVAPELVAADEFAEITWLTAAAVALGAEVAG